MLSSPSGICAERRVGRGAWKVHIRKRAAARGARASARALTSSTSAHANDMNAIAPAELIALIEMHPSRSNHAINASVTTKAPTANAAEPA